MSLYDDLVTHAKNLEDEKRENGKRLQLSGNSAKTSTTSSVYP
jgi:hypothetical protein